MNYKIQEFVGNLMVLVVCSVVVVVMLPVTLISYPIRWLYQAWMIAWDV